MKKCTTEQAIRLYETIETLMEKFENENNAWTREVPTESGSYWWWNEDRDADPIHIEVMYSGTSRSCFAPAGQYGWTRAQEVSDMGGWWMKLKTPAIPKVPEH